MKHFIKKYGIPIIGGLITGAIWGLLMSKASLYIAGISGILLGIAAGWVIYIFITRNNNDSSTV